MEHTYRLINVESDEELAIITEEQVQFLIGNLEEEGIEDDDYYIDEDTLSFLAEAGCDKELLEILSEALEGRTSIDVRYEIM